MMNESLPPQPAGLPIAAVERETGIPKDLLRMWERRYGFPDPDRDPAGDRLYAAEQVAKLKLIRRLMDKGFRPGKLMPQSAIQLTALLAAHTTPLPDTPLCDGLLAAVQGQDPQGLQDYLRHRLLELGLRRFVTDFLAAANIHVGEAWMQGHLQVYEEHLYSEAVARVLREALQGAVASGQTPRVMLTTCPGELHMLGLLMVEALLRLEGCETIAFGPQMPLADIAAAAAKHRVDVVVLSFSQAFDGDIPALLAELAGQLAPASEIWFGGGGCRMMRQLPAGVHFVSSLASLGERVADWRH